MKPVQPLKKSEILPAADAQGASPSILPLPSDTGRTIRAGILLLLLGFGSFLVWAVTAPLDEGVPAPGVVIVESNRKLVQHLTGGVVREVLVKEAQSVRAGDLLVRLDDTQAKSAYESTLQTLFYVQAMEARLLAEQGGAATIRFEDELLRQAHPKAVEHVEAQRRVFAARRAFLASQIAVVEESAATAEIQAAGYEEQRGYLRTQLSGMRDLAAEGYAPKNRQLELERQFSELQSGALRARRAVAEAKLRAAQLRQEFRRDVETQLADIKRERANNEEKLRSLREDLDRTRIKAPTDGFVTGLAVHTLGGVIGPGFKLMEIVPVGDTLILDVRVATYLIDRVLAGQSANISFHSFPNAPDMVAEGRVISVSADQIIPTQQNEPAYYLAKVEVTSEGMKILGKHQMQPGMPVDVVIKSGERSFVNYLLKPLLRRVRSALTEA